MSFRESDIRPADLLAEYLRLSEEDGRRLLAEGATLEERPCPGCAGNATVSAFEKNGFSLVRCRGCGTLYVNPAPSAAMMEAFYRDSPSANYWARMFLPAVAENRRQAIYQPRAARVAAIAKEHGLAAGAETVTDVGAGAGLFLGALSAIWPEAALHAVEPGAAHAEDLRSQGWKTFEGYAEDAAGDPAWASKADLVTCFEVLEHVSNPAALFESLAALARPGGLIVVSGLSGSGFDIQTLGERANAVSPPHHLTFLSNGGSASLIRRCGLECLNIFTPGELDVDIVRNAAQDNPECISDPFLRHLILEAPDDTRVRFQAFLKETRLSSHMWIVARRPGEKNNRI